ncbi:hypothetical protein ACPCI0_31850 [Streptomyces griseoincarnatus]
MPVLTAAPPVTIPGTTAPDPAAGRRLVEQAVATGALQGEEPECFVRIDIPGPRACSSTTPGPPAADRIALAADLDVWSWIQILERHLRLTHRGRIEIRTHPLRPVLADVEAGYRGDETARAGLARALAAESARLGLSPLPAPGIPRWAGVGPRLHRRQPR